MSELTFQKLEAAYSSTIYQVRLLAESFDILIGELNPAFSQYCERQGIHQWAVITAYNPRSEVLPDAENQRRNEQLAAELREHRVVFRPAVGLPANNAWKPEVSFFLRNISQQLAIGFATKFQQNAIVVSGDNGVAELLWLHG